MAPFWKTRALQNTHGNMYSPTTTMGMGPMRGRPTTPKQGRRAPWVALDDYIESAKNGHTHIGLWWVLTMATLMVIGAIVGHGYAVENVRTPTTLLTVTAQSVDLEGSAYATAVTPVGQEALLKGLWVPGDTVNAFAWERSDAPDAQPIYSTTAPWQDGGALMLGIMVGLAVGIVIPPLLLIGYALVRRFATRRKRRSDEIINAVLS